MDTHPIDNNEADQHLSRLLVNDVEVPWWKSLVDNIKEVIEFNKLPPLVTTSTPVAVRDIWGDSGNSKYSVPMSVGLHIVVVLALIFGGKAVLKKVDPTLHDKIFINTTDIEAYTPKPAPSKMGGGGGGGDRSPDPASKGRAPRFAAEQFAPPTVVNRAIDPKLMVEATVIGPPEIKLASNMSQIGDPMGVLGPPSNGTGYGGGIGSGHGGGVGSGDGGGVGPGSGGGFGGGAFKVGGGVSPPSVIYKVEPEFTEAARKAKYQGTVLISVIVEADGHVKDPRVVKAVGLGLDEKALEAVRQWKFKPGMKDGRAVPVYAQIEVTFRLL
jgi:periplasmic protein TonB